MPRRSLSRSRSRGGGREDVWSNTRTRRTSPVQRGHSPRRGRRSLTPKHNQARPRSRSPQRGPQTRNDRPSARRRSRSRQRSQSTITKTRDAVKVVEASTRKRGHSSSKSASPCDSPQRARTSNKRASSPSKSKKLAVVEKQAEDAITSTTVGVKDHGIVSAANVNEQAVDKGNKETTRRRREAMPRRRHDSSEDSVAVERKAAVSAMNELNRSFDPQDILQVVHKSGKQALPIFDREEILSYKERPGDDETLEKAESNSQLSGTFSAAAAAATDDGSSSSKVKNQSVINDRGNFTVTDSHGREASAASTRLLSDRWKNTDSVAKLEDSRPKANHTEHGKESASRDSRRDIPKDLHRASDVVSNERRPLGRPSDTERPRHAANNERHPATNSGRDRPSSHAHAEGAARRPSIQERLGKIAGNISRPNVCGADDLRHGLSRRPAEQSSEGADANSRQVGGAKSSGRPAMASQIGSHSTSFAVKEQGVPNEKTGPQQPPRPKSKTPDFSRRPDKGRYEEWMDNPLITPKGDKYFMHDDRECDSRRSYRGRTGYRGGQNMAGRPSYSRGDNRDDFSGKGGGFNDREWRHDMFDQSESNKDDNNPTSTTNP